MKRITAYLYYYLQGNINYGHFELEIDDETYLREFEPLEEKRQKDYLRCNGKLILDDFDIDDRGPLSGIEIEDIHETQDKGEDM